jgi:peptide/nickel transport system substrate-binding protein
MRKDVVIWIFVIFFCAAFSTAIHEIRSQQPITLRVGWTGEPDSMNPFVAVSTEYYEIMLLTHNVLIEFGRELEPIPGLAEKWESSPDGLVWTYHLVKNAKWHDGQPFTSKDVKFTLDYVIDNQMEMFSDYVSHVTSVDTPDDYTVVLTTDIPTATMEAIWIPMLPEHIWKNVDPKSIQTYEEKNPIGTGPFKFVEWKKGEYLKLAANDDYFGGRPAIDEVIFVHYANSDVMIQALKLGEIDVASSVPPTMFEDLSKTANIKTIERPQIGFVELGINTWDTSLTKNNPDLPDLASIESQGNPLLLDKRIRTAMSHAIDRQKIVDIVLLGHGTPGSTLVSPGTPFWHLELPPDQLYEFNLEKAKKILQDAGYVDRNGDGVRESGDGKKLEFRFYLRSENADSVKAGQMIEGWFKEIGIKLNSEVMDDSTLGDRIMDNGNFDLFIWGWGGDPDPSFILSVVTCPQILSWSDCNYCSPTYDELFRKQSTILDRAERQKMIFDMQRIFYEDSAYIILYYDQSLQAYRTDKFEGWVEDQPVGVVLAYNRGTYTQLHLKGAGTEKKTGVGMGSVIAGFTLVWLIGWLRRNTSW